MMFITIIFLIILLDVSIKFLNNKPIPVQPKTELQQAIEQYQLWEHRFNWIDGTKNFEDVNSAVLSMMAINCRIRKLKFDKLQKF